VQQALGRANLSETPLTAQRLPRRILKSSSEFQAAVRRNQRLREMHRSRTGHAETSEQIAKEMAASGQYKSIHLNQTLRTITRGAVNDSRKPDVAGVTHAGHADLIEIPSASQSSQSQRLRLILWSLLLGPLAGPNSRVGRNSPSRHLKTPIKSNSAK